MTTMAKLLTCAVLPGWIALCLVTLTFGAPLTKQEGTNSTNTSISNYSLVLDTEEVFVNKRIHPDLLTNIKLTFRVRFKKNDTPPVIYFHSKLPGSSYVSSHVQKSCFKGGKGFRNVATLTEHFVLLSLMSSRDQCEDVGEHYICSGERGFRSTLPRSWWIAVGYECKSPLKGLNISIVLSMVVNQPIKCTKLDPIWGCKYAQTVFPNVLGHTKMRDAVQVQRSIDVLLQKSICHQHYFEFSCRVLYPECKNDSTETRVIVPCRKMCEEVALGCSHILKKWNQELRCGAYPESLDPKICFYEPVMCSKPSAPEFGSVITHGRQPSNLSHYTCNGGYILVGNATVSCTYAGRWNGTVPKCRRMEKKSNLSMSPATSIVLSSITVIILFVFLATICIYCKRQSARNPHMFTQSSEKKPIPHHNKEKTLFLTYSSMNSDIINDVVMPGMREHLSSWRVMTFETDFLPGLRVTECIEKSVADSDAFVILLTPHYANSDWCLFEFTQAEMKAKLDSTFKLVFILHGDDLNTDSLQENLKKAVKTNETLSLDDEAFWKKLYKYLEC